MKAKYFILSISILALSLIACEKDFFETESPSAMDEAVFKSADLTQQAIGAIYNTFGEDKSFRNRLCGGYVAMNTDIEHCSKTEDKDYAAYNITGGTGDLSTSNGKDPWAYLNSAIERANVVVDGIRQHSDTTDATFKYLLGEALTLRAFCYLEMVKLWGDVPASFESFNGYNSEVLYTKKQPRSVVYEQLRKDLKEAAELMPWSAQCPGMARSSGAYGPDVCRKSDAPEHVCGRRYERLLHRLSGRGCKQTSGTVSGGCLGLCTGDQAGGLEIQRQL